MKLHFPFTNSKNSLEFSPRTTTQRPWRQCLLLPRTCMKPKTHSSRSQHDQQPWPSQDPEVDIPMAALQSERLFYDPEQGRTSSIMEEVRQVNQVQGPVAEMVQSADPMGDFRRSMEEMVASQGAEQDWSYMAELLSCYLRFNSNNYHDMIIAAFTEMMMLHNLCSSSPNSVSFSDSTYPLFSIEEEDGR